MGIPTIGAAVMAAAALCASPWGATVVGGGEMPERAGTVIAAVGTDPLDEAFRGAPGPGTTDVRASGTAGAAEVLGVRVPPVVLGRDDGLPAVLVAGGSTTATITVLPAERGPRARVSVLGRGVDVAGCRQVPLPAGTVSRLACRITVPLRSGPVAVLVVARGGSGSLAFAAYRHRAA